MIYQIAIIGGGLAGLALAIDLRKKGYEVIVIEKGKYPRQKVCGEYISMESYHYLFSICPALSKLNLPHIHKFKLTTVGKNEFNTTLPLGGFGISRFLLEDLLFQEAKFVGVTFMLQTKATHINFDQKNSIFTVIIDNKTIIAQIVCNATGRKSNFETTQKQNKTNATNYVGIKYHIQLKRDADLIEIHNFPGGYGGISTIEDNKSCLCYIVNSKKLNAVKNSIAELEKTILFQNIHLKEIFTNAVFITPQPISISGINFQVKKAVDNEILFLGDAAGCISPITGNGMSMALRSASQLTILIDDYFSKRISKKQLQKNYAIFWQDQFANRVKLSKQFQKLSENPFLTHISIQLFNIFPLLAQQVIKLTHGKPF
jgi:menaquinone-9 beta-reductase